MILFEEKNLTLALRYPPWQQFRKTLFSKKKVSTTLKKLRGEFWICFPFNFGFVCIKWQYVLHFYDYFIFTLPFLSLIVCFSPLFCSPFIDFEIGEQYRLNAFWVQTLESRKKVLFYFEKPIIIGQFLLALFTKIILFQSVKCYN